MKVSRFLTSRGFILLLVIIIVLTGFKYYQGYKRINKLEEEILLLNQKIEQAREDNEKLKQELTNINDPEYIEQLARRKLGLVKPGEVLLIPVEDKEK